MLLSRGFSRRQFLKLTGAASAVAMLNVTTWSIPAVARTGIRSEWTFSEGLPPSGPFETPVLQPETSFDAVDMSWLPAPDSNGSVQVALRVLRKDDSWSEWATLEHDQHAPKQDDRRGYIAPVLRTGKAIQVQITIEEGSDLQEFTVGTLDTSTSSTPEAQAAVPPLIDGMIIPRAGWGANESWRYEKQDTKQPVIWPPEYQQVEKIIVHHTVTDNDPPDPAAAVRAIYYYHAITQGWGDIGYNFLVDWEGRVYEGRFGGKNVVGGHALQYNHGSVGIALLGDFSSVQPSPDTLDALVKLIKLRAPQVDVTTAADFIDLLNCPNLCGHRDVLTTSCPGDTFYPLIPTLRGTIAGTAPIVLDPPIRLESLELVSCQVGPTTVYQNNLLEVRVKVKNTGTTTLQTGGPDPGYVYDLDETYDSAGFPKVDGEYRFGLDYSSNSTNPNPFRWGFGDPIAPGEEREVIGYVRMRETGTDTWSACVIKEYVRYLYEQVSTAAVSVSQPPVGPVAQSREPGNRFFSETGHNVPAVFAAYWDANGGLTRFGYPLTEAFLEVSETDGGTYVTQYFERARFEYHPEYSGTQYEVLLGLLGTETCATRLDEEPFKQLSASRVTPGRQYFAQTGHTLGSRFQRFWEANGGLPIFGYPISEEFEEYSATDGVTHIVQYFERNRFEYHPDYAGTKDEVMLGHLAREILIHRGWLESEA